MLQDVLCIYNLEPLVHLVRIILNVPWKFSCSCIVWHCRFLWGTIRALEIMTNYGLVCGWLNYRTEETILSPTQFWLDGWRVCLNFAMDFADDFVVDDPLQKTKTKLEVVFAANIFRFGSHSRFFGFTKCCVLKFFYNCFHQVWCAWFFLVLLK